VAYVEGSHVYERNSGEPSYTLAYVNFAEGKTIGTADDRVYYLKDHLGSTRITLASDFTKKEAIVYKAYGSEMVVDNVPATDILRARFTGKELDKEGAQFGQLTIDIKLDFALINNPDQPNRLGVYFEDAPQDVSKAEILVAEIDPVSGYGRIRGTINYTAERTISWIHFKLNDDGGSCAVQNIGEVVGPGKQLSITQEMTSTGGHTVDGVASIFDRGSSFILSSQSHHFRRFIPRQHFRVSVWKIYAFCVDFLDLVTLMPGSHHITIFPASPAYAYIDNVSYFYRTFS
jgi:hypothetical protein